MRNFVPLLCLTATFLAAADSGAQTQPAPVYSLPPDGTWVEYDCVHLTADGKELKGTLRISSVGQKRVDRERSRWVELRLSLGDDRGVRYRKLLLSEEAIRRGRPLAEATRDCFDRTGNQVRHVTGKARLEFLGMAVRQASLRDLSESEEVLTKLGRYQGQHFATDGPTPYHAWLCPKIPFGWVRFEVRAPSDRGGERIVFRAVATRTGDKAMSEVDESSAK